MSPISGKGSVCRAASAVDMAETRRSARWMTLATFASVPAHGLEIEPANVNHVPARGNDGEPVPEVIPAAVMSAARRQQPTQPRARVKMTSGLWQTCEVLAWAKCQRGWPRPARCSPGRSANGGGPAWSAGRTVRRHGCYTRPRLSGQNYAALTGSPASGAARIADEWPQERTPGAVCPHVHVPPR